MEKISIVQRRRNKSREIETSALIRARQREEMSKNIDKFMDNVQSQNPALSMAKPDESFNYSPKLDIELPPDQSNELNSLLNLNDIMKGSSEEANVKIFKNSENKVVFHFSVQTQKPFQALTSEDVCQMLKISRKTLYKSVHKNIIPGFKIGTQLRFLAEDIMAYLKANKINN